MVMGYAIVGGLVALIPGASFFLIALEVFMLWQIAHQSDRFNFGDFLVWATGIAGISFVLKGLATFLHLIPLFGQLANAAVAFAFITFVGHAAEKHFK